MYTFYKKVWVPSGINAFGILDLRFDHQVVALKKGMQPIQFTEGAMPILQLGTISDSTLNADTVKTTSAVVVPAPAVQLNVDSAKSKVPAVKSAPSKSVIAKPMAPVKKSPAKAASSKASVKPIVKKTTLKSNNKANNKSLNKVKKTAKAEMPKKLPSNNN